MFLPSFFFVRRVYKERLGVPPKVIIGYQSHADTATKSGSTTKNKFVAWGSSHPHFCKDFLTSLTNVTETKLPRFCFLCSTQPKSFLNGASLQFKCSTIILRAFCFCDGELEMSKRCFGAQKFKHHCLFFPLLYLLSSVPNVKKLKINQNLL